MDGDLFSGHHPSEQEIALPATPSMVRVEATTVSDSSKIFVCSRASPRVSIE